MYNMTATAIKTPARIRKESRELAIYNEYVSLIKIEGAQDSAVSVFLMGKYGIGSRSTIWNIRQRVARRLSKN